MDGTGDRRASRVPIRRICVRYGVGRRACFIPEAGEEFFSRDDLHGVVGMLQIGSEHLEWSPAQEGETDEERFPGTGWYSYRRRLIGGHPEGPGART